MEDLLLIVDGETKVFVDLDDNIRKLSERGDIERRTVSSVVNDLKSGEVWIQCNPGYAPFLACREGWQYISEKVMRKVFESVSLKRTDHLRGVQKDGKLKLVTDRWTWRYTDEK